MAKPIPSLKKPSASVPVEAIANFVEPTSDGNITTPLSSVSLVPPVEQPEEYPTTGEVRQSQSRRRSKSTAGRRLEERKDGTVARKVTIYLPPEIDRQLSVYALDQGVDRSEIVVDLLARHFKKAT